MLRSGWTFMLNLYLGESGARWVGSAIFPSFANRWHNNHYWQTPDVITRWARQETPKFLRLQVKYPGFSHFVAFDVGVSTSGFRGGAQGRAPPPPFEIPKRVFKEGQRGRTPPAPPPLWNSKEGLQTGPPLRPPSTNPGSAPGLRV